jgi:hypothetical protein
MLWFLSKGGLYLRGTLVSKVGQQQQQQDL